MPSMQPARARAGAVEEKFRWYDSDFGFFAESVRSNFPIADERHPKRTTTGMGKRVTATSSARPSRIRLPSGPKEGVHAFLARMEGRSRHLAKALRDAS